MDKKFILFNNIVFLFITASFVQMSKAQEFPPFTYTHVYTDSSGESHFSDEQLNLVLVDPGKIIQPTPATSPFAVSDLVILCPSAGESVDWHPAPKRQFNFILEGLVEVEVSDGETRQFGPGSVILVEDVNGKGHRTNIISDNRVCFAGISLGQQ